MRGAMLGRHSVPNTVVLVLGEGMSKYQIHGPYFGHHSCPRPRGAVTSRPPTYVERRSGHLCF
jgi:hypothetical protein